MSSGTRHLLSLPLDTALRSKLICCGFTTVDDFKDHNSIEALKKVVNVTETEAKYVLNVIDPYINSSSLRSRSNTCGVFEARLSNVIVMKSAAYLLKENLKQVRHIISFSSEVDKLMGGGFPLGRITELAGEAGLGKTQFCLQLCVDVQIPAAFGGVDGEAVFLDVEGTFFPQRMAQITTATVNHCHNIAELSEDADCLAALKNFTVEKIMSHIYLFSCRNCVQLLAAAHQMKEFLKAHPKVKLLIVDTVAQSVRGEEDMRSRSKYLTALGRIFRDLVADFDIAVVLTNQVTTKILNNSRSYTIPALGTKWSHLASVKLMIYKQNGSRYVHQYKSPDMFDGIAEYRVAPEGIRDVENASATQHSVPPLEESQQRNEKFYSQINPESSISSQVNSSSIHFYPITQGIEAEMMNEWELQEDNTDSTKTIKFLTEEIPDKWLELSQQQLCDKNNEEFGRGSPILSEKTVKLSARFLSEKNNLPNKEKTEKFVKSSQNIRIKTQEVLKQTIDAMLSCESPARSAPKGKRKSGDAQEVHVPKKSCVVTEPTNDEDYGVKVKHPFSPVLESKQKKLQISSP